MNHVQVVFMSNSAFGWIQIADNWATYADNWANGSNYAGVTVPSIPFNSIFIFKDSNFLRVCSFVVFNSNTVNF